MTSSDEPTEDRVLVITRVLDAPPGLVFRVWTEPEHFVRWLGPKDFTAGSVAMDVRPGGTYRACIRSPAGKDHWMSGVYREVRAPDRLVFTFAWEEEGERGPENLVTVTFTAHADGTELTFRQAPFPSVSERDSHDEGWSESFDRLAAHLATVATEN